MSVWPDFFFQPVNLWNYPKQYRDYKMSDIEDMNMGGFNEDTTVRPIWKPKPNVISHPSHYTHSKFETWDVIDAWGLGYNLGNVVKYISRADHKASKLEDLKKAKAYLSREIETLEFAYDKSN